MKHFVIYQTDGRVLRYGTCMDETFNMQAQGGESIIEAEFTGNQYVENGALVNMPEQPSDDYVFDYETKAWMLDLQIAAAKVYAKRDQLLRDGPDRISPMWWASMTAAQQQEWTDYRQALLDVPQQPGFPTDVVYPVAPSGN